MKIASAPRILSESEQDSVRDMLEEGYTLKSIADLLGFNPKTIVKLLKRYGINPKEIYDRRMGEKKNKIKKLYEEGKNVAEISRLMGEKYETIMDHLKRMGAYITQSKMPPPLEFTENEIRTIDMLYEKGVPITEIAKQFGTRKDRLITWFNNTGRSRKSKKEQFNTQYSRDKRTQITKDFWERVGKLEGYLISLPSRPQAENYLNGVVNRMWNTNPQKASAIKRKYMEIINDHTYPDEVQQEVAV